MKKVFIEKYNTSNYIQEKLKAFLSKIESNNASFKQKEQRVKAASTPKQISKILKFNENIMIRSNFNNGFLVANIPKHYPNLKINDQLDICTSELESVKSAKSRAVFQIEPGIHGNIYKSISV